MTKTTLHRTITNVRSKGAAAALTVTAVSFSMTGFAAACSNSGYNDNYQSSSNDWNHYKQTSSKQNDHGYDYQKHGDKQDQKHDDQYKDNQNEDNYGQQTGWNDDQNEDGYQNQQNDEHDNDGSYGQDDNWGDNSNDNSGDNDGNDYSQDSDVSSDSQTDNQTDVNISNDVNQSAESGDATSQDNYDGGTVTTGHATNSNATETAVLVDNTSKDGQMSGMPSDGSHGQAGNSNQGWNDDEDGSSYYFTSRYQNNREITNITNVTVNNTINQYAVSGDADSSDNYWGGTVQTGDATNTNKTATYVVVTN